MGFSEGTADLGQSLQRPPVTNQELVCERAASPRLLKLQRAPTSGFFGAMIKEGLYSSMMSIFGGVPFLPDEAIPGRKGEVASFRQDFRKYLSMAETETAQPDFPS